MPTIARNKFPHRNTPRIPRGRGLFPSAKGKKGAQKISPCSPKKPSAMASVHGDLSMEGKINAIALPGTPKYKQNSQRPCFLSKSMGNVITPTMLHRCSGSTVWMLAIPVLDAKYICSVMQIYIPMPMHSAAL